MSDGKWNLLFRQINAGAKLPRQISSSSHELALFAATDRILYPRIAIELCTGISLVNPPPNKRLTI